MKTQQYKPKSEYKDPTMDWAFTDKLGAMKAAANSPTAVILVILPPGLILEAGGPFYWFNLNYLNCLEDDFEVIAWRPKGGKLRDWKPGYPTNLTPVLELANAK
jgi:hypothetical protein